mgnify:CR=1 FL=1
MLLVSDSCTRIPKLENTRIKNYISIELEINLDGKRQGMKDSRIGFEIELIKENGSVSVVMD